MEAESFPEWFLILKERHPKLMDALQELGEVVREEGPLNERTAHLVQLAAAAAIRSEGAVHSHVKRALEGGVPVDEIRHALILLTSTIGFPAVSAALSWAEDITGEDEDEE